MKALYSTELQEKTRKAFLVGVQLKGIPEWKVHDSLEELEQLVWSLGGQVLGRGIQRLDHPHPATFIGPGKAEEFAELCRSLGVDTVVFDDELTPAQTRNLEEIFQAKIVDRTMLILDIFAQRAQTREAQLQVELARLEHILPRLRRYWKHLSRQPGGIGIRGGEGETQLEQDRRKVKKQIDRLKEELEEVRRQRAVRRQGRRRREWPLASLVGYTNAGKSTLFNALTGAHAKEADKLFATLDPLTRLLELPTNQKVLLSDTVGFIRKLPHLLIDAFKATLEEVVYADLLLHVVDVSHPQAEEQIETVEQVLKEIGADGKPTVLVLNKIDLLQNGKPIESWLQRYPYAVPVSAKTGQGLDMLMAEIANQLRPVRELVELEIPHAEGGVTARVYEVGEVLHADYSGSAVQLQARIPPYYLAEFAPYLRRRNGENIKVFEEETPIRPNSSP